MDAEALNALKTLLNNKDVVAALSKKAKTNQKKTKQASELSISTLLEALNQNTNTQQGAESLTKALDRHQNSDLSDILTLLQNSDQQDNEKIVDHVLGQKKTKVQTGIAKKTGLDAGQIGSILTAVAPVILGVLGNQKKKSNLDSAGVSGTTSLLSGLFGGTKKQGGTDLLTIASSLLGSGEGSNILDGIGKLFT
jgi:hypothetical protein